MKKSNLIIAKYATFALLTICHCGTADAGLETWHHIYDMPYGAWFCMESCTHTNGPSGAMQDDFDSDCPDVLLQTLTVKHVFPDDVCVTSANPLQLGGSISVTRSISVTSVKGNSNSAGFELTGEAAKGRVETAIGFNHSWDWSKQATFSEQFTINANATVPWPLIGEKFCKAGAKVYIVVKAYGNTATAKYSTRIVHQCATVIQSSVYIPGQCHGYPAGSVVITKYSGDGAIECQLSSTGKNPTSVVITGPFDNDPKISDGCNMGG